MTYTDITEKLKKTEEDVFKLFLASVKKRIGYDSRISIEDVIKGFNSKGMLIDKQTILKFHYHINKHKLIKCLIYDGDNIYSSESDTAVKDYKKSLIEWYNVEENAGRKALLGKVANAIG